MRKCAANVVFPAMAAACIALLVLGFAGFATRYMAGFFRSEPEEMPVLSSGFYPMTASVVMIDEPMDAVVIESMNGNLWVFYGIDDWQIGDGVSAIMYDNGTLEIADDEIVMMRYFNWHPTYI